MCPLSSVTGFVDVLFLVVGLGFKLKLVAVLALQQGSILLHRHCIRRGVLFRSGAS